MGVINRFQPGWGHLDHNHHHHHHILTIEALDVTGRSKTPRVRPVRQLIYNTGYVVM